MFGRVALVVAIVVAATAPTVAAQPASESKAPGERPGLLTRCADVPHAGCGTIERPLDPRDPDGSTITIGFELHRANNRNKPSLGTIVAVEGGPGYASTDSRDYYLDLFAPLLARRDVLFVDARERVLRRSSTARASSRCRATTSRTSGCVASSSAPRPTSTAPPWPPTTWPPCSTRSRSIASTCTATRTARSSAKPSPSVTPIGSAHSHSTRPTPRRPRPVVSRPQPSDARRVPPRV